MKKKTQKKIQVHCTYKNKNIINDYQKLDLDLVRVVFSSYISSKIRP